MKQLIIILFCAFLITSCKAKDIIDLSNEDDVGDVDDITFSVQPENLMHKAADINVLAYGNIPASKGQELGSSNSRYVPQKPLFYNAYNGNNNYRKFASLNYKPRSYWYSGERKSKLLAKAKKLNSAKKREFVSKIGLRVVEANEKIIKTKDYLNILARKIVRGNKVNENEEAWLNKLASSYKLRQFNYRNSKDLRELQSRVGIVPESLAVAQAAIESAWGKSRFAKQGNNYFGQWCYSKGCGIVPAKRDKNKNHEVKIFKSPLQAVEAYIHNLNTHSAYKNFRIARENMGSQISGVKLSAYLDKYSAKGSEYGKILQKIIIKNELE